MQQWRLNATLCTITAGDGHGCLCSTENPKFHGQLHCRYPSCVDAAHPKVTSNEIFTHDPQTGWIWSTCNGANCPNDPGAPDTKSKKYCATADPASASAGVGDADSAPSPQLSPEELAAHPANRPADHPNCIPWSIDPQNTKPGWYWDAGMDGMVLTANDTLISVHEAEKFTHLVSHTASFY